MLWPKLSFQSSMTNMPYLAAGSPLSSWLSMSVPVSILLAHLAYITSHDVNGLIPPPNLTTKASVHLTVDQRWHQEMTGTGDGFPGEYTKRPTLTDHGAELVSQHSGTASVSHSMHWVRLDLHCSQVSDPITILE